MPLISFDDLGKHGIVKAISDFELIPNAWSGGNNIRFAENRVKKVYGATEVFTAPSVAPYFLQYVPQPTQKLWLYAGLTAVYATDMASHYNITGLSGPYSATAGAKWNGTVLGGVPIINNGVDTPQSWIPVSTSQVLTDLANWPASTTARIIRSFKQFAIALDITKSGTRYPMMVKWSHPADPGAVPASWDETDATKDAGETDLAETPGFILDAAPLGADSNLIYKSDSVYLQQYVGGQSILSHKLLYPDFGVLATNCILPFRHKHLVVTSDDILIHRGGEPSSILTNRWRKQLFTLMDTSNYERSFLIPNYPQNEIWFFFCETGETQPRTALIWNWTTGALSLRNFDYDIACGAIGVIDPAAVASNWDADSEVWDADAEVWDYQSYDPANTSILLGNSEATPKLYKMESTNQFAGVNYTSYVERTGLAIVGRKRSGAYIADPMKMKYVNLIVPKLTGSGTVNIYVGSQETIDGAVTWSPAFAFTIGTDIEATFDVTGRFIAVKFESTDNGHWELDSYQMNVVLVGTYYG